MRKGVALEATISFLSDNKKFIKSKRFGPREIFLRARGAQSEFRRAFSGRVPATMRKRPGRGHAMGIRPQGESLLLRAPSIALPWPGGSKNYAAKREAYNCAAMACARGLPWKLRFLFFLIIKNNKKQTLWATRNISPCPRRAV